MAEIRSDLDGGGSLTSPLPTSGRHLAPLKVEVHAHVHLLYPRDLNQANQAPDLHNACIQLAALLVGDSLHADHSSIGTFEIWLRHMVDNGV